MTDVSDDIDVVDMIPHANDNRALNAHLWARHPEDWYVEPDWLDDALFAIEHFDGTIYDPACGSGRILRAADRAGLPVLGTDLVRRCPECSAEVDFFEVRQSFSYIVSNPPFGVAEAFIKHALEIATRKVAMILPARFMFGDERSLWLETTPLRRVYHVVPRPSMPPGPVIEAGIKAEGGKQDFVVLVWSINFDGKPESAWLRNPNSLRAQRARREAA